MTELRRRLRAAKIELKVIKNTFLARAFEKQGIAGMGQYLAGPTVVAFGYDEPATAARLLAQFARDNKELHFKAGVIEGRVAGADLLQALADLPSRDELLARVLWVLRSPLSAMARALAAPAQNMALALAALERKRGAAA